VVVAAVGVTMVWADNNLQRAAAGATKMADVAAAEAEIAQAATVMAAAAAEAVAVQRLKRPAAMVIAMGMVEGVHYHAKVMKMTRETR
jgi:hypothetical protein